MEKLQIGKVVAGQEAKVKAAPGGESLLAVLTVAVGRTAVLGPEVRGDGEKDMEATRKTTG